MKRKLLVIGIGAGNPDHVTLQAVEAIRRADVFFIPDKGDEKAELARVRLGICERFVGDRPHRLVPFAMPSRRRAAEGYDTVVSGWHDEIGTIYARLFAEELREHECGAFLVWGDPALYDSTLRIIDGLNASGGFELDCEVIPGITAIQALAAAHRLPLNRIGQSIMITTGRKLAEGLPRDADSVVVMLDAGEGLRSVADDTDIWWGANVGTADEALVAGRLDDVIDEIERRREALREKRGWVMDTYLLRRRDRQS